MQKLFYYGLLCLSPYLSLAQTVRHLDDYTMSQIDNVITSEMSQSGLPGVSIGLIYNGRIAYTKAYGLSSPGTNATTSSKYPIASVSKTITGIMAMRMVANGDLALNTTIDNYIGGYNGTAITIRHLLSHQSGIGHYDNCPGGYNGQFTAFSSQLIVMGCSQCMTPPGSGTIYTTFGTTLLGVIIDVVGRSVYNKGYIQLYNEWIRDAAGLTNLTAEYTSSNISNLAWGYSSATATTVPAWSDLGWRLPAGGFVGTAHDLAGYGVGVMNYTFLNSTSSAQMWTVQTTSGTPTNNCATNLRSAFGLAFFVGGSGTNLVISHDGENNHGYCSSLILYPNQKAGMVLLTNRVNTNGALGDISNGIEDFVLCPARRDFNSLINWTGNWVYESSDVINASNGYTVTAANGSMVFDAQKEVVLKPGFYATSGTNFRAMIEGCGGAVKPY